VVSLHIHNHYFVTYQYQVLDQVLEQNALRTHTAGPAFFDSAHDHEPYVFPLADGKFFRQVVNPRIELEKAAVSTWSRLGSFGDQFPHLRDRSYFSGILYPQGVRKICIRVGVDCKNTSAPISEPFYKESAHGSLANSAPSRYCYFQNTPFNYIADQTPD
jgi:hypothetical protein